MRGAASVCIKMVTCAAIEGPFPALSTDASGGFTIAGEVDTHIYAFRAESGDLMFAWTNNDTFFVGTRTRTIAEPLPGAVSSFASLTYSSAGVSGNNFADGGFVTSTVDPLSELMMKPSNCDSSSTVCAAASKVLVSDACLSPVMSMRSWYT